MADAAAQNAGERSRLPGLTLAATGVVFGDIGTSPLYTMREAFGAAGGLPLSDVAVLGILSLVFWALVIVVSLKYVTVIMRADNRGEGGVLALSMLAQRGVGPGARRRRLAILLAVLGAALFYGDGVITPAISVLSAVEGLHVATPLFEPYVVPLAVAILVGLFLVQSHGTSRVGRLFGPIICLWFLALAVLGLLSVIETPTVLRALNPAYALHLFQTHGWQAFIALGAVVLAVTGAEALYADMGHFGRLPIRLAWFGLVLPALLLNYFGQGALLIRDSAALANPFYLLAPGWALYPMVLLATLATVIASQAVISGAFSLTRQAVQLGYLPRMQIRHTSEQEAGQIYVPRINWMLMIAVLAVVLGFQSSGDLAAAYGIAVTGAMLIDVILAFIVARTLWHWSLAAAVPLFAGFLVVDLAFFGANALKIPAGGWFPLLLAAIVYATISTWRMGREALFEKLYKESLSLEDFLAGIRKHPPQRVRGTAVFLSGRQGLVPRALLHNLKHNKVLHERIVVLTVLTEEVPRISEDDRFSVEHLDENVHCVVARYGFMEDPNVPWALARCRLSVPAETMADVSFFLSRETLVPSARRDLSPWREQIFIRLSQAALSATEFFRIPRDRVIEIGSQIEI